MARIFSKERQQTVPVTDLSTRPADKKASRAFAAAYIPLLALLIVLALASLAIVIFIQEGSLKLVLSDVLPPTADLVVAAVLFIASRKYTRYSSRLTLGWTFLALSMVVYAVGDLIWLVFEIILKTAPFPSIADVFYLAYYPVTIIGIFLLLDRPTRGELVKRGLDISIVMVAAILGVWNFLLAPIIQTSEADSLFFNGLLIAYPVGDLVLLTGLLFLLYDLPDKVIKRPLQWLCAGIVFMILADTIYSYQSLLGTYVGGGPVDPLWIISTVLLGQGGLAQWKEGFARIREQKTVPNYSPYGVNKKRNASISVLPYLWLLAAFLLLLFGGMGWISLSIGFLPLAIGVGVIICLIVIRQVIALRENSRLNVELHKYVERVQSQAVELEKANLKLEMDIDERKQVEEALRASEAHLSEALRMARMGYWEFDSLKDEFTFNDQFYALFPTTALKEGGYHMSMARFYERFVHPKDVDMVEAELRKAAHSPEPDGIVQFEHRIIRTNGEIGHLYVLIRVHKDETGRIVKSDGVCHDITERVRTEEEIKKRLGELEAVSQVSAAIRQAPTLKEMLPLLLGTILDMLHAADGAVWLYDAATNELLRAASEGTAMEHSGQTIVSEKPGEGINGTAFESGQPFVAADFQQELSLTEIVRRSIPKGIGGAAIPIRAGQSVIGTIEIDVPLPRELKADEIHLLTLLSEIAGNAIQRITLHQQTERRLQQLMALSNIDRVISSTADIHLSLGLLLEHVTTQLKVDATDVLLFNQALQTLEFSIGRGFRTKAFEQARLRLGEGYAGRAVLTREIVYIPDLAEMHDNPSLEKYAAAEQFVSYYGVPLIARGQVKGVLEIFQRTRLEPDKEWLDFLSSLVGQAAIAIESAMQLDNLQRSNSELRQAYDETIEGWSRALDLRDNETEGHTQRVTEMTVALAREAGFNEMELLQVRWGALLHDIGKMGVPDSILLKAGPLTDEEWVVMRKHPILAYEMISPIRYLRGALDIPYCHHEKWDGTGYPRGLKGEQIPLAARIFAVVDVWDALCSDRPYCSAWPDDKVLEYILAGSGTHFDPKFVDAFMRSEILRARIGSRVAEK
jgi:putative nucleotidyltransferase with HDIG domain